jgi:cyanophycinase
MKKIILSLLIIINLLFAKGFICAVGGGAEATGTSAWNYKPYKWIVEKANYGKIVILSISDTDTWLPNYFKSLGASEVINVNISSKTQANDQNNFNIVNSAKGIFIKGGDQYDYISYWKGTLLESAIKNVYNSGGVIAGTSAGAMILGQFYFTAKYGSVYTDECIKNPFTYYANIDNNNFLNLIPNVIFDTHVSERGRVLRLLTFVFQTYINKNVSILGIGIDDQTALCIDTNHIAKVYGSGAVHFTQIDASTQTFYDNQTKKYTIENIRVDMLVEGWEYDITNRKINYIPQSAVNVNNNNKIVTIKQNCIISGNNTLNQNYYALKEFIKFNLSKVAVLYNSGSDITYISNFFNQNNVPHSLIEIKSTTLNDANLTTKISEANGFIFYGNTLSNLYAIADTTYLISKEIKKKIENTKSYFLFIGNAAKMIGNSYYDNYDNSPTASLYGKMTLKKGLGITQNLSIIPRIFENRDYYENRVNALLYAVKHNQDIAGFFIDSSDVYKIMDDKIVKVYGTYPTIMVNGKDVEYYDSSKFLFSSSISYRQVIGAVNLRFSISNIKQYYIVNQNILNLQKLNNNNDKNTILFYPNPFNPIGKLILNIKENDFYNINLYDILGRKIKNVFSGELQNGMNEIIINLNEYPTGIYIIRIESYNFKKSIKINLQK